MKNEKEIENQALSQTYGSKAFGCKYVKLGKHFCILPAARKGEIAAITDRLCKGPPGRPRSPGARGHPPETLAVSRSSPLSACREGPGVSQNPLPLKHEILINKTMNNKQILIFNNLLIFKS